MTDIDLIDCNQIVGIIRLAGKPTTAEILAKCRLTEHRLTYLLQMMDIMGVVSTYPGGRWVLKENK